MGTLRQASEDYIAPSTLNIADLEIIPIDCPIKEKTFKEGTDDAFTINVATYKGLEYRVPNTVLDTIKTLLKEMPELNFVKVLKEGQGMNTKYKVVPKADPKPVETPVAPAPAAPATEEVEVPKAATSPTEVSSQQM